MSSSAEPRDGFLFVRGVGTSARDASLKAAAAAFDGFGIDRSDALEANWSWSEAVHWPFGHANDARAVVEFLRVLGPSMLNSARAAIPAPAGWYGRAMTKLAAATLRAAEWIPLLTLLAVVSAMLGFWIAGALLVGVSALLAAVPVVPAALSLSRPTFYATLRAAVLHVTWPLLFLLLGGSVASIAPAGVALLFLPSTLSGKFIPYTWRVEHVVEGERILQIGSTYGSVTSLMALIVGIALAAALVPLLLFSLQRLCEAPLKIFSDITRYVGDAPYRAAVQQQIVDAIETLRARGCTRVFIFAHSLGTVITVDTLTTATFSGLTHVYLATAGSPLHRFFHRFFPASYETPGALCSLLQARFADQGIVFDWINVFRKRDPVGVSLGLPGMRDFPTDQPEHSILTAHVDYWSDPHVHQLVDARLTEPRESVASSAERLPAPRYEENGPIRRRTARAGLLLFLTLLGALPAVWLLRPMFASRATMTRLAASGVRTEATVHRSYTKGYYEPSPYSSYQEKIYFPRLDVAFAAGGTTVIAAPQRWLVDRGELGNFRPAGTMKHPATSLPVHYLPVTVRYLPEDPRQFTIEGYEGARWPIGLLLISMGLFLSLWLLLYIAARLFWPILLAPLLLAFAGLRSDPPEVLRWKPVEDGFTHVLLFVYPALFALVCYLGLITR